MRRRLITILTILAASFACSASAAVAAPSFGFTEATHKESVINRGDERVTYSIKLKNTGDATTAGSTNVAIGLPAGMKLAFGSGSSWTCHLSASVCSSSAEIAPNGEFQSLSLMVWIYPDEAPASPTATFTAFGGGAVSDTLAQDNFTFGPEKLFEILSFTAKATEESGSESTTAGDHPFDASSSMTLPVHTSSVAPDASPFSGISPVENLRDLYFDLPAGFMGNLASIPAVCTVVDVQGNSCPQSAAVGGIDVDSDEGDFTEPAPLYRIVAEEGYVAAFALKPVTLSGVVYVLRAKVRTNGDYGVAAIAPLPPQSPRFLAVKFATLCSYGAKIINTGIGLNFGGCRKASEAGLGPVPFLTNPTRCAGDAPVTGTQIDSWQNPGSLDDEGFPAAGDAAWKGKTATAGVTTTCVPLTEAWTAGGEPGSTEPSFDFQPDTTVGATPAAYKAHLHVPQDGLFEVGGLATAHLKDTTVNLPEGLVLNPSAANALGVCSESQAGLVEGPLPGGRFPAPNPIHFKTTAPGCPANSKVGTVEVTTPVLEDSLPGSIYLAAQDENPFGSRFAIYIVVDDDKTGIHATLAGEVTPNLKTGQITTSVLDNPQVPVEDFEVQFFDGPRTSLANPDVCGTYVTATEMTPWSAVDPYAPAPSEVAVSKDPVMINAGPNGAKCPNSKAERPFALGFDAGTISPVAGAHSPFVLRITRPDGSQELSKVQVTTPPGFAATLKGVSICSNAQIAAAEAAGRTGRAELANPSCPASSQVGTTTIGSGVGPTPFYVKTGKIYLTGPYKNGPLSLTFVVPAVAGPFDLGVQVVKTTLQVNPKTAQVTAVSDPIPQILDGVPLQIRDVRVELDRPAFTFNPTNCEAMAVNAEITGGSGAVTNLDNRFQVGGCENLGFKPNLKLQLHGGTKRADYQQLTARVTYPKGNYANIARAAVTLPHSAFLAQEHIRTVCTRVQFAAHQCPQGSIYGTAEAETPVLDGKLTGPVYLRSSNNPLPDLVVALRGPDAQPIEVELAGRTDSVHGGIRNTFDIVPDAPVSKFTLRLFGGQKSLIINSRDLCKGKKQRATVRFTAQNGKERNFRPLVGNDCAKKGKGKKKGRGAKPRAGTTLNWLPMGF